MSIRAIIIDDEKPARDRIHFFLEDIDKIEVIGEAANGLEGLELLEREHPDLIFLDIQMPKLNGFGLLERCSYQPAVIFISAYDEYALHAFEVNAVDYLLKPFTRERFNNAVNKVLNKSQDSEYWEKTIFNVLHSFNAEMGYLEQITVKQGNSFKVYDVNEIDFFRMEEGVLYLYSKGDRIYIDTPLNHLELKISPSNFLRVHRNAFVNLKKINEVIPWGQGRFVLNIGKSGSVHVSREKVKILKEKIGLRI